MTPFIGQIQAFAFGFVPVGWYPCDGSIVAISQNEALFSLLGTIYGGNGSTTFALPDLRGRSIVHAGTGNGLSGIWVGQQGGWETMTLTTGQLPAHNHALSVGVNTSNGEETNAQNSFIASHAGAFSEAPTADVYLGGVTASNIGGNQPINIRNPYLGIQYYIAMEGYYPSRS